MALEQSPDAGQAWPLSVTGQECFRQSSQLVLQWLGTHLLMQETRVCPLDREDPTCHRARKPGLHSVEPVLWSWDYSC